MCDVQCGVETCESEICIYKQQSLDCTFCIVLHIVHCLTLPCSCDVQCTLYVVHCTLSIVQSRNLLVWNLHKRQALGPWAATWFKRGVAKHKHQTPKSISKKMQKSISTKKRKKAAAQKTTPKDQTPKNYSTKKSSSTKKTTKEKKPPKAKHRYQTPKSISTQRKRKKQIQANHTYPTPKIKSGNKLKTKRTKVQRPQSAQPPQQFKGPKLDNQTIFFGLEALVLSSQCYLA